MNKSVIKHYSILAVVLILVAAAAYIGGRMLNRRVGPVGLGGPNGGCVSISLNDVTPAPELPNMKADITGLFVERKDNTIIVQAVSFGASIGGVSGDSPMEEDSGIRVEILVTGETLIYKDVTQIPPPVNGEIHNLQQAAEVGTLDDLNDQTFITVWGRRSGDRIVADVLFYSNPQMIKKPGT
jgi:hypothetical protein